MFQLLIIMLNLVHPLLDTGLFHLLPVFSILCSLYPISHCWASRPSILFGVYLGVFFLIQVSILWVFASTYYISQTCYITSPSPFGSLLFLLVFGLLPIFLQTFEYVSVLEPYVTTGNIHWFKLLSLSKLVAFPLEYVTSCQILQIPNLYGAESHTSLVIFSYSNFMLQINLAKKTKINWSCILLFENVCSGMS